MAKARKGLGRGLSALLADTAPDEDIVEAVEAPRADAPTSSSRKGVDTVPIEFLVANPDQPRRTFDDAAIEELAQSIKVQGLLQPILVRPLGDGAQYQIVAGERRWRAAQRAGLHEAPVVIRELDDRQTAEIALVENVQRTDLNPLEEASAYQRLVEDFGHAQEEIAKAVGKSRSHVANLMRLLKLPKPVRDMVDEGALSMGHARAILTADDPEALAKRVVARGLSVRETERLAKETDAPASAPKQSSPTAAPAKSSASGMKDADTRALENDLAAALGLEVDLNHSKSGGVLTINYRTLDQLDDVCRRLLGSSI